MVCDLQEDRIWRNAAEAAMMQSQERVRVENALRNFRHEGQQGVERMREEAWNLVAHESIADGSASTQNHDLLSSRNDASANNAELEQRV